VAEFADSVTAVEEDREHPGDLVSVRPCLRPWPPRKNVRRLRELPRHGTPAAGPVEPDHMTFQYALGIAPQQPINDLWRTITLDRVQSASPRS
jgi:hypothetical protein